MFADIRNRKRWNRIILICFLFLNIFRIVMDDTIRSEQALSSQSVLSVENLAVIISVAVAYFCGNVCDLIKGIT